MVGGHHVFCGRFAELDFSDWVLEDREFLAWTAGLPVLAKGGLTERNFLAVWVAVDIDVGDAHCDGWLNVWARWLWCYGCGNGMPS